MKKKHPLQENYERFFGRLNETYRLQDLENDFYENERHIRQRMKDYGFDTWREVDRIKNYVDLASILGIDSRLLKNVEIETYAGYLAGLLSDDEDDDEWIDPAGGTHRGGGDPASKYI